MTDKKRLKIGLALGSGGAKGLAHIGIIKVLEENNIPIDFIAGSSIGALVGGFYAATKDIKQIEKIAFDTDWRRIFSLIDPSLRQGLIRGEKIRKFIESYVDKINFQDLKIPFTAVATDIGNGQTVYLNRGEVASAVRASISTPLVFKPVKHLGKRLADGGLSLPVPVKAVKDMGADFVIAVNTEAHYFRNGQNSKVGFLKIANSSLNILRYHLADYSCQKADLIITPEPKGNVYWNKFLNGEDIVLSGEKAAKTSLPQLKESLRKKAREV